ncbi:LysR family transcriptional regulator [Chamaesiphon polymorphus]|uniref:LysR family transcriptional regulator n=1 Tax=Chamaesiphon polymorphus CCALA 037 TaxID=2107692 RepID=A0A2T1FE04_9CYAN|nr:LysR family transcriptional regulator [Chamaesiphon polymorphus]PSB43216.1 LysR family transcriptional regulator [Chamaesiphon polymorphus CCALA 037]
MKLSQLRILVAIAKLGNFSEAAVELNMSQSAVSHAIAALEAHLGVVLFLRGRHGAKLTAVGAEIVIHAREITKHAEEIDRAAIAVRGLTGGQVRVASFRSIATYILPSAIGDFYQRFPAIAVNVTEHEDYLEVERVLQQGDADIGVTFLPASDKFQTWEMLQDEFVALCPPSFAAVTEPQITWAELISQPLIMPPIETIMMQPIHRHLRDLGYVLPIAYEVETDATIVRLVAQGLGATILPRLAAEPIPANVRVYHLPVPFFRTIGLAILAEALQPPAVYAFLEILKQQNWHPEGNR